MQKVNTHEAKTKLSWILFKVEKDGKTFRICRNGVPVADLVPIQKEKKKKRRLRKHPLLSKIKILYDPTEPLPPEDWGDLI